MANHAPRHASCKIGSGMCGVRGWYGSRMIMKPFWYVVTSVTKSATSCSGVYSPISVIWLRDTV